MPSSFIAFIAWAIFPLAVTQLSRDLTIIFPLSGLFLNTSMSLHKIMPSLWMPYESEVHDVKTTFMNVIWFHSPFEKLKFNFMHAQIYSIHLQIGISELGRTQYIELSQRPHFSHWTYRMRNTNTKPASFNITLFPTWNHILGPS